jgi:hypothetical protein
MTHIFISPLNEYPRHIGDIHREHLDFDGVNLPEGWKPVTPTEPPTILTIETYFEIEPVLVDGNYFQAWGIRNLTEEEIYDRDNPPKTPREIGA